MTNKMIDELNRTVWAALKPSKIHGIGVFAIRDIPQGTKIGARSSRIQPFKLETIEGLHPKIKELILQRWPLWERGLILSPNDDARLISFMNHSDNDNYDPSTDRAICDIMEGEEITEDYRIVPNYQDFYPFINGQTN